ncbi:serine/threonine-protein kinase [Streptomyces sp. NPDC047014]|uniref:serine/threonine-protein kinase n=1 Tax=Streptomyces sp. NPDC047014 TaxID=3155736 RepID=UPI003409C1A6
MEAGDAKPSVPKPRVGAGRGGAGADASSPEAEPSPPAADAGEAEAASAKPEADAAEAGAATPGPADAASAPAKDRLSKGAAGAATPAVEPPSGEAEAAPAKDRLSKGASDSGAADGASASAEPGAGAGEAAPAKGRLSKAAAEDAPVAAKPDAEAAPAKGRLGKAGAAKPAADAASAPAEPEEGAAASVKSAPAVNPVVEKADAVAAAVKAAAAKAADNGQDEGRLLAGRYRLRAVLGKGGMGTVWRAQDETLGRTVAVKELRFGNGVDEDEKRRLITRTLREAKAIARIRSGGAVTVYDVVDEDGRPWIVMELIEGPSLAEFIRENGPLTPHRAAEVGLAVLDVLRAAHGQGILHRDVKPSNVLIAGSGRVVLTDFGIAQVEGDPSVTSTGMLVGAPSYISPERARGQKPGPPADMWSLGGLLYASVEGVPPYDKGSALATLTAVMTEPVEPPKNAGPLTEVIYGLLVKDPDRRLDEARARTMLTAVLAAPEPVPAPVAVAAAEETRQISLADAKEAAEKAAADKAAEKAAKKERDRREREQRDRARAALKAARKAASVSAATAAAAPAAASAAEAPKPRPGRVPAPLTDVMPRRTIVLAVVAVVAVLAVVGSLIAYALSGDDKDTRNQGKNGQDGKATPAASAPQDPGGNGQTSPKPSQNGGEAAAGAGNAGTGNGTGNGNAGQPDGQGQQSAGAAQGQGQGQGQGNTTGGVGPGGELPAGYTMVQDFAFHFSMAMPEGFKMDAIAGENSGAIYNRDGGFPRIQVDHTNSPGNDARLAWTKAVSGVAGSSKGYRTIRIDQVDYRGYPTVADWEFEREQKGIKVRVLNRGFKVDGSHGYAIMISCAADQWDGPECTQMRNVAFQTFQPLG